MEVVPVGNLEFPSYPLSHGASKHPSGEQETTPHMTGSGIREILAVHRGTEAVSWLSSFPAGSDPTGLSTEVVQPCVLRVKVSSLLVPLG